MVLSKDLSALVGFACEAVLWGAYYVLFVASTVVFLRRSQRAGDMNIPIFTANCALFASCTAHFLLELSHYFTTLSTIGVKGFANETKGLVGADLLVSLSNFIGQLVLLYRCWVIWGRNFWVVLFPFITALCGFACIAAVAHIIATTDPTAPRPSTVAFPLGLTGYTLPLVTNAIATALIVARLYLTARRAQRDPTREASTVRAAMRAMTIIVESGALYLATQLTFVVLFAVRHPALAIVSVMAAQIYGIAPTLMVMQVALGFSSESPPPRGSSAASQATQVASGGERSPEPQDALLPGVSFGGANVVGLKGPREEAAPKDRMEMKFLALRRVETQTTQDHGYAI